MLHCCGACSSAIAEGKMNVMNKADLTIERETADWKTTFKFLFSMEFVFSEDLLNPRTFLYIVPKAY